MNERGGGQLLNYSRKAIISNIFTKGGEYMHMYDDPNNVCEGD